jgi:hypothetical protein
MLLEQIENKPYNIKIDGTADCSKHVAFDTQDTASLVCTKNLSILCPSF